MAKSSFVSQLARGFVRSAVNQVGRDGGRVISNQIYNGQNYIPVAGDANAHQPNMSMSNFGNMPEGQATSTTKPFSTGKIVFLSFLSIFIPLACIVILIYGIAKYTDKTDKILWYEDVPQYTRDRRYKTGTRYLGTARIKKQSKILAPQEVIDIHKRNGIIAMSIGGVGILTMVIMSII